MAEKQKTQLSEADIEQLRSVIKSLVKSDSTETKEFLKSVKQGMDIQSKNFAAVLKTMQKGFIDFKSSGSSLEKIFKDISMLNGSSAKDIIKILSKYKALKSGTDIQELEKFLLKDVVQNKKISIDLENDEDYAKITKLISLTQKQATFLDENLHSISESISNNADEIDETLSHLALFHKQLEKLSGEYKKQGIYQDIIGVNINASKGAIDDLLVTASKYTDMLSLMDIPVISADDALNEYGKLKSDINSDKIDIAGQVGLNFKDASTLMSNTFNSELDEIMDRVDDIKENILAGILAIGGFTQKLDDTGKVSLTKQGMPMSGDTSDAILENSKKMQEMFNTLAGYNAMILRDGSNQLALEQSKVKFTEELIANHIELGLLQKDELKFEKDRMTYMEDYIHQIEGEIESLEEKEQLLLHIHTSAMSSLAMQHKAIKLSKDELSTITKYRDVIQSVEGTQSHLIDQLQYSMTSLPLWTQNLLGTDKILDSIKSSADKAFNSMTEKLFNPDNPTEFFGALSGYTRDFVTNLLGTVNPIKLIGVAFVAAGIAAYNIMSRVKDISSELGISKSEAYKLYDSMLLMEGASGNIAVTQERMMQMQQAHLEKYGRLIDMSTKEGKELVEYGSLMSSAYGIAADEATSMIGLFKQIGAEDGLAKNLAASTLKAAELAKISPKVIAKDLIDGAEEVSMYFGNMPEQAALAAINIRRMGSNIKKVGEQMQSTWNIESFMTNMYEVAQLTGSEINLTGVFDAGIKGDAEEFQASLLDALGSLDELNNYSPQAQKKIAETIGMSVGEMKNMLRLSEMNLSLTKEEQSALNGHLDTMGDITGMTKSDLEAKAKQFAATEAMDMAWSRITSTLTRAFLPIIEVVSDILVALAPVIDIIGLGFKLIGLAIKPFIPALKSITWLLGLASTKLSEVMQWMDGWIIKGESIGNGMGEWVKIGGSFLLLGGLMISQWSKIGSLVSGIFSAPMSMMKGMVNMARKLTGMGSLFGKGTDIASTITSTVTNSTTESASSTVMDKIKEQKDKLIERFTSTSETSTESSGPSKSLQEKIKSGMDSLKEFTNGLADSIMEPIKKIGAGIGDVFKSIFGGIADGMNKFTPKAAIGAAAMLIVSGAVWVMSKAMQEFNSVEWDSVAKGLISMAGLAGVAMLLGKAAPQMLIGSVAMAVLGVALIPLAYALNMFNDVNWDSIAKGGVALIGFGIIAAGMGAALPFILAGALAIAALGASMMVFGAGLTVVALGLDKMTAVTDGMVNTISKLKDINPAQLVGIATGLTSIGLALSVLSLSSMQGGLMSLFVGDPITKIAQLASAAPAISLLAASFMTLVESLKQYAEVSSNIPDTNIKTVKEIATIAQNNIPEVSKASANVSSVENISKETNYTNTTSNTPPMNSNSKMEILLSQLVALMQEQVSNPIPAVIGNDQIPSLAKKVKSFNNK